MSLDFAQPQPATSAEIKRGLDFVNTSVGFAFRNSTGHKISRLLPEEEQAHTLLCVPPKAGGFRGERRRVKSQLRRGLTCTGWRSRR